MADPVQENARNVLPERIKPVISPEKLFNEMNQCKRGGLPNGFDPIPRGSDFIYADHYKKEIVQQRDRLPPPDHVPDFIDGWARFIWFNTNSQRRLFYYHRRTNCYQWENPELLHTEMVRFSIRSLQDYQLPKGWRVMFMKHPDPEHRSDDPEQLVPLFINDNDRLTSWNDPRVSNWKINIVKTFLRSNIQHQKTKLIVRNQSTAFLDANAQIARFALQEFHAETTLVRYGNGIAGFDLGGLSTQLFHDYCNTLKNEPPINRQLTPEQQKIEREKYAFEILTFAKSRFIVNLLGGINKDYIKLYYLMGRFMGLMLQHGHYFSFIIGLDFYQQLINNGEPLTHQQLMNTNSCYVMHVDYYNDKDTDLTFLDFATQATINSKQDIWDFFFKMKVDDKGKIFPPSLETVEELEELKKYLLIFYQVQKLRQTRTIINGLKDTIPFAWFKLFYADELATMFQGCSITITADELLEKVIINTSHFFEIVQDSAEIQQAKAQKAEQKIRAAIRMMSSAQITALVCNVFNRDRLPPGGIDEFGNITFKFSSSPQIQLSNCFQAITFPANCEQFGDYQNSTAQQVLELIMIAVDNVTGMGQLVFNAV